METVKGESREYGFYQRIVDNLDLWTPISTLVQRLREQGVLAMFICCDKIEELNSLLSAKLPQFKPFVTSETYNEAFEPLLLQNAISKIYDKKQDDATDTEIKDEIKNFVDNLNWAKIFEVLWRQAHMIMKFGYHTYVKQYKRTSGITAEDSSNIENVFKEAFPMGEQGQLPVRQWVKEHEELRNAFNLYDILTDAYIDNVFGNIQHMSKKPMNAEVRETTDIIATECAELQLMVEAISKCGREDEKMSPKEMYDYVETIKKERPLYIMAVYYVYAHKSFALLTSKK